MKKSNPVIEGWTLMNKPSSVKNLKEYDILLEQTYQTYVTVWATSKEEANRLGYQVASERELDQCHIIDAKMTINNKKVKIIY